MLSAVEVGETICAARNPMRGKQDACKKGKNIDFYLLCIFGGEGIGCKAAGSRLQGVVGWGVGRPTLLVISLWVRTFKLYSA